MKSDKLQLWKVGYESRNERKVELSRSDILLLYQPKLLKISNQILTFMQDYRFFLEYIFFSRYLTYSVYQSWFLILNLRS